MVAFSNISAGSDLGSNTILLTPILGVTHGSNNNGVTSEGYEANRGSQYNSCKKDHNARSMRKTSPHRYIISFIASCFSIKLCNKSFLLWISALNIYKNNFIDSLWCNMFTRISAELLILNPNYHLNKRETFFARTMTPMFDPSLLLSLVRTLFRRANWQPDVQYPSLHKTK